MKSLLCAVLIAEVGCWSASSRPPIPPTPPTKPTTAHPAPAPRGPETCTEGGDRLVLRTCRESDALVWTLTNGTDMPMWAFVAPRGTKRQTFSVENALARGTDGQVVLSKRQLDPVGGELIPIGAVLLAPGASSSGRVPVGTRIDAKADNITGAQITGSTWIHSVALEIGFAPQRSGDRPIPTTPEPLVVLLDFKRSRQEIVIAPSVPWR